MRASLPLSHTFAPLTQVAIAMQAHCERFRAPDGSLLQMRIGLVTGPAVGGVLGASMLRCAPCHFCCIRY